MLLELVEQEGKEKVETRKTCNCDTVYSQEAYSEVPKVARVTLSRFERERMK